MCDGMNDDLHLDFSTISVSREKRWTYSEDAPLVQSILSVERGSREPRGNIGLVT